MSKYFGVPFANSGDKTTIPDASQPSGDVSFTDGYTPDYEKDQATDPDAKDVSRQSENYFKFSVTEALKEIQEIGGKPYDSVVDYPVNAIIQGSDGIVYRALVKNGPGATFLPVVDPVGDDTGTWTPEKMIYNSVYDMIVKNSTRYENQKVQTLSFYDGGLIGGVELIWVSSQNKNTANGGTIIDPDNIGGWDGTFGTITTTYYGGSGQGNGIGSGCWVSIDQLVIAPEQFGITQDNVDQKTLIEKMFNAVITSNITRINGNKNGTYRCDTTVTTAAGNVDIYDFDLNCQNNTNTGVIFTGSAGATIPLTSNAVRGDVSVEIASGQSISPGDVVFLNSGTVYWKTSNSTPFTEFRVVKSYVGTTLTFHDQLEYPYTTGGGADLYVASFVENINLINCGGIATIGNTSECFEFNHSKDCSVYNSKFKNFDDRAVGVKYSINIVVFKNNFTIDAGTATGGRYGVAFGAGAESCKFIDNYCSGLRHPCTMGGEAALTRRCVEKDTISLNALSGLDQHPACDECTTHGYVEFSSEVVASEDGAVIQGNRATVDVRVKGSTRHGMLLQFLVDNTGGAPAWIKANGSSEDSTEAGVVISIIDGGQVNWVDVDFNADTCGTNGGLINIDNGSTIDRLKVRGRYETLSTILNAFQMLVVNASGSYAGYIDIDGEFINAPASTTQVMSLDWDSGILHADGGRIAGKFKNGTTGARTLDSNGNLAVGPIITQNVTTPYTFAGANNVIFGNVDF